MFRLEREPTVEQILKTILVKLDNLESDVKDIKTDVKVLKTDVKVLKANYENLRTDVKGIKANYENLRTDVKGIKEEHGQMLRAILESKEVQRGEIDNLTHHTAKIEGTIIGAAKQILGDLKEASNQ